MFVGIGEATGEVGRYPATPPSLSSATGDGSVDKLPKRPNRNRVKLKDYQRPRWNTGDEGAGYRRPGCGLPETRVAGTALFNYV